jgi:DNA modification methylase
MIQTRHSMIVGDARRIPLASRSVHCVVTSPPYFGLRDYGAGAQIGLEKTATEYVAQIVSVFRELRRVLRNDGTAWLNIGDSYTSGGRIGHGTRVGYKQATNRGMNGANDPPRPPDPPGLKAKELCGIPWRVAFALQNDGWYLRADVIWSKTNPMTESVLDRPAKSHEYVFLLAKSKRYYYDSVAVAGTSSLRTVWRISCEPYRGAHFAAFPAELAATCIKAGTSERGVCPKCAAPWVRITERIRKATRPARESKVFAGGRTDADSERIGSRVAGNRDPERHVTETKTLGWEPSCQCSAGDPVPSIVLDPFAGVFTTSLAAKSLGRHSIGIELRREHVLMGRGRMAAPQGKSKPAAEGQGMLF